MTARFCHCGALVPKGPCPVCSKAPNDKRSGRSSRWDNLSRLIRRERPLCERCRLQGRVTASRCVHHLRPVKDYPDLEFERSNLQALCHDCHQELEGKRFGINTGKVRLAGRGGEIGYL